MCDEAAKFVGARERGPVDVSRQRDTIRQGGPRFVMIDYAVFDEIQMKPTTLAVYCGLMMHANEEGYCFPSRGKLAERVGVSVSTVRSAITELVSIGLLEKHSRFDDTGEQMSNEYVVYRPSDADRPELEPEAPETDEGVTITDRGANFNPLGGQNITTPRLNSNHINYNQLTRSNELDISDASQNDDRQPLPPSDEKVPEEETETEADPGRDQPYPMLERVTTLQGAQMSMWTRQMLGRQLKVAKRLIDDGVTIAEVELCVGWLQGQKWVESIDMFMIERKLGDFRLARSRSESGSVHTGNGIARRGMTPEQALGKYYRKDGQ